MDWIGGNNEVVFQVAVVGGVYSVTYKFCAGRCSRSSWMRRSRSGRLTRRKVQRG